MKQNRILDIIINLLDGIKNSNKLTDESLIGGMLTLNGCSYLLNQTIRQYQFPSSHYFVSQKAQELWDKISTDSIFNYTYRDTVIKNIEGAVSISKFRGGEGAPYKITTISRGDSFVFKDVFTDEHIVTVSNIIDELLSLSEYTYEAIENVLNKIYICKMLKSEDRAIKNKKNRSTDYRDVVLLDYDEAGIKLTTFDYKKHSESFIKRAPLEMNRKNKAVKASPKTSNTITDAKIEQKIFWDLFEKKLAKYGNPFTISYRNYYATVNRRSPSAVLCLSIDFLLTCKYLRVGIYINDDISVYKRLYAQKGEIEKALGFEPMWIENGRRNPNTRRIESRFPFVPYELDSYDRLLDEIFPYVEKYIQVFGARLGALFNI